MANPSVPSTPSAAPAAPSAVPQAAKPVTASAPADPKAQVKAVTESVKTGQPVSEEMFEVQIDGKPVKKSKKEILEAYQLRELSDKKRSEADKVLQEYNKLFEVYKKDPIKFMKATGVDFENLATQFLAKKAEDAMMDPKDRELREAKYKAEQYEKYLAEQKSAQEKEKQSAAVAAERSRIHAEIIQALEERKDLGLPTDESVVIQIAQQMMVQDKKRKPLDAKEALSKTYERSQQYLKGIAAKMEGEQLVKWLGDDVAKKIRRYDLAQLKAKRSPAVQPQSLVQPKVDPAKPAPKYKTWSQFKSETLDKIQ